MTEKLIMTREMAQLLRDNKKKKEFSQNFFKPNKTDAHSACFYKKLAGFNLDHYGPDHLGARGNPRALKEDGCFPRSFFIDALAQVQLLCIDQPEEIRQLIIAGQAEFCADVAMASYLDTHNDTSDTKLFREYFLRLFISSFQHDSQRGTVITALGRSNFYFYTDELNKKFLTHTSFDLHCDFFKKLLSDAALYKEAVDHLRVTCDEISCVAGKLYNKYTEPESKVQTYFLSMVLAFAGYYSSSSGSSGGLYAFLIFLCAYLRNPKHQMSDSYHQYLFKLGHKEIYGEPRPLSNKEYIDKWNDSSEVKVRHIENCGKQKLSDQMGALFALKYEEKTEEGELQFPTLTIFNNASLPFDLYSQTPVRSLRPLTKTSKGGGSSVSTPVLRPLPTLDSEDHVLVSDASSTNLICLDLKGFPKKGGGLMERKKLLNHEYSIVGPQGQIGIKFNTSKNKQKSREAVLKTFGSDICPAWRYHFSKKGSYSFFEEGKEREVPKYQFSRDHKK
jgi:hypothetical protein